MTAGYEVIRWVQCTIALCRVCTKWRRMLHIHPKLLLRCRWADIYDLPSVPTEESIKAEIRAGRLVCLASDLYYRPKISRLGTIPVSKREIIRHFTCDGHGMLIGYYLYNKYNLTTQISKHIEILSNRLQQDQATIGNANISKVDIAYMPERIKIVEALEILQHYQYIEDFDEASLRRRLSLFCWRWQEKESEDLSARIASTKNHCGPGSVPLLQVGWSPDFFAIFIVPSV